MARIMVEMNLRLSRVDNPLFSSSAELTPLSERTDLQGFSDFRIFVRSGTLLQQPRQPNICCNPMVDTRQERKNEILCH